MAISFFSIDQNKYFLILSLSYFAQSAGAVEYTDCTSAEG